MTLPRVRLRKAVTALLVLACAALGGAWPRWSFALYELGYYSEAKQADALAGEWRGRADLLRAIQAQCARADFRLCALIAGAERALALRMVQGYEALANDPPDADYASVAVPGIGTLAVGRMPVVSPSFAAAWAALFANHARTAALLDAFVASNERRQGAALAQDARWAALHAQLTALYASELGNLVARHPALAQAAIAAWKSEGLPTVRLENGPAWPDLLGGLGIAIRTQQFARSMATLGSGGLARVEFDLDVDAAAQKSSEAAPGDAGDLVRVVIEGGEGVDVADIDPLSLRLGPGLAVPVDGDAPPEAAEAGGSARLVLRFTAAETGLDCRDDVATLLGSTFDGRAIGGLVYLAPGVCAR